MKKITTLLSVFLLLGLTHSALALTLSPVKVEVSADPGQTITGQVDLLNEEGKVTTYYTFYENFEARGESGAPYFIGAKDGLATWITSQPEVVVSPQERTSVPYTIRVPANAKPGGYFAALLFGTQPPENENDAASVSIGSKVGTLILLRVNGDIDESAGLSRFSTKNDQKLFSGLPIGFEYTFNNAGGDRVVPTGEITVYNTFKSTATTLKANEGKGSVLPSSTRKFSNTWEYASEQEPTTYFGHVWSQLKEFHFGWYTAELDVAWGTITPETATARYGFMVIPWQLLSLIIVILVAVLTVRKQGRKQYKKKILAELGK